MPAIPHHLDSLEPEGAYAVLARAQALEAEGRQVVHFEIGQPDFLTFDHISQAGMQAIASGQTRYNPPAGMPALRQVIAQVASLRYKLPITPAQVIIGPGAKPGLFFSTLALVEPGDEVLYPDPGFPTYPAMIRVAGGVPVPVPLLEEKGFSFDLTAFDRLLSPRTKLVILNSPANPTGGVMPLADLQHIATAVQAYDCWVMSDEIYARLVYDKVEAPSIIQIPGMLDRTVIVDGFSKTYAMTGWRLGYCILPELLAVRVALLLTHSIGCTATFTQIAGIAALTGDQSQAEAMVSEYQARRDRMVAGLNSIPGIHCQVPAGAFYVFPNVRKLRLPTRELTHRLLDEAGVAVLPGNDFGAYGAGYLRLCYATSQEQIEQGLEKISAFCRRISASA